MALMREWRAVGAALRQGSPVVTGVPNGIRALLLQRYVEMSTGNGRLSLASFGILLFGLAYEAPLAPRLAAWGLLAAMFAVRSWRVKRWRRRFDPAAPRSDPVYDLLVLIASSFWGVAPWVLQGWVSPFNLFGVIYAAFVATALLTAAYWSALPAAVVLVLASVIPLVTAMAAQGSLVMIALAVGTLICTAALLMRVASAHGSLLQSLAAERQNAALVQELQTYRHALESENASLGSSLRDAAQAANRDPLTGLFNRRHVLAFAAPLAALVASAAEDVTVCMVDVDHFKSVNDRHGHAIGDEVLRAIANLLMLRLRDGDCLARYGGEEFVVVLRHCDVNRGRRVAESLRHNVAAAHVATGVGEVEITVSLGLAQWAPGEDFDDVVARADGALYEAKHSGRDRVAIHGNDEIRLVTVPMELTSPGSLH